MILPTGSQTPANVLRGRMLPIDEQDISSFKKKYNSSKARIRNGEVFSNNEPEDLIAKVFTEAHWAMADMKRGRVNLKHSLRNNNQEGVKKARAQIKRALSSLSNMIKATDVFN